MRPRIFRRLRLFPDSLSVESHPRPGCYHNFREQWEIEHDGGLPENDQVDFVIEPAVEGAKDF